MSSEFVNRQSGTRKLIGIALAVALVGAVVIGFTSVLDLAAIAAALEPHRRNLITAEVAIFAIILVEITGRAVFQYFDEHETRQVGVAVRAVIRVIAYMALSIAIISLLSASPALAVGVGGMMGIVIAFSTQNIIANVFAGMFIALGRPFAIGDEITVMGSTGRVVDFTVLHTQVDVGERIALIPNASIHTQAILLRPSYSGHLTQAILRTKHLQPYDEG